MDLGDACVTLHGSPQNPRLGSPTPGGVSCRAETCHNILLCEVRRSLSRLFWWTAPVFVETTYVVPSSA